LPLGIREIPRIGTRNGFCNWSPQLNGYMQPVTAATPETALTFDEPRPSDVSTVSHRRNQPLHDMVPPLVRVVSKLTAGNALLVNFYL
jgi:hypothetical protein